MHKQNILGEEVVVAVIDTGTTNNLETVPSIAGNVVGGENFVENPSEPSATSKLSDFHSSMVVGRPTTTWHGMRELYICDPDGYILALGATDGAPPL